MKLNRMERLVVNNPLRAMAQQLEALYFKSKAPLASDAQVLEIGCGRGAGAQIIRNKFQPNALHLMDLDIQMIQQAYHFFQNGKSKTVSLHVGDAAYLAFQKDCMDAVFEYGILHHVPDWQRAVSEIARVIKPGGWFIFEELYPGLYQNVVTRRLLDHPVHNRFHSPDFKAELHKSRLFIKDFKEHREIGILGVARKA